MKKSVVLSLITHIGVLLLDTLWQPRDSWPFTWILRDSVSLYGVLRPVKILQSRIVQVLKRIKKYSTWDFSGGPVVETPCFQCKVHGCDPWWGNWRIKIPTCCLVARRNAASQAEVEQMTQFPIFFLLTVHLLFWCLHPVFLWDNTPLQHLCQHVPRADALEQIIEVPKVI